MHPISLFPATPNAAVALATLGLCLIFLELNRPGRILPGAAGLLLTLLALAALLRTGVRTSAACLLLACAAVFLGNLWWRLPWLWLAATTLTAVVCLRYLLRPGSAGEVSLFTAGLCGASLGLLSAVLTRVAYRARRAKALD